MYKVIASGSKGNAVLYFGSILVDCGVPFSLIEPYQNDIQIVLPSHVHHDHLNLSTIKTLQFNRPTVRVAVGEWMIPHIEGLRNIDVLNFGKWYDYQSFKIALIKLYHDVPTCGYRIFKEGEKIFHATDSAHLEGIEAKDYNLYAIEHNYNEDTVFDAIARKEAKGEFAHQKGAINSHLSEQQARDFYFKNKGELSKLIRLHESTTGY